MAKTASRRAEAAGRLARCAGPGRFELSGEARLRRRRALLAEGDAAFAQLAGGRGRPRAGHASRQRRARAADRVVACGRARGQACCATTNIPPAIACACGHQRRRGTARAPRGRLIAAAEASRRRRVAGAAGASSAGLRAPPALPGLPVLSSGLPPARRRRARGTRAAAGHASRMKAYGSKARSRSRRASQELRARVDQTTAPISVHPTTSSTWSHHAEVGLTQSSTMRRPVAHRRGAEERQHEIRARRTRPSGPASGRSPRRCLRRPQRVAGSNRPPEAERRVDQRSAPMSCSAVHELALQQLVHDRASGTTRLSRKLPMPVCRPAGGTWSR